MRKRKVIMRWSIFAGLLTSVALGFLLYYISKN